MAKRPTVYMTDERYRIADEHEGSISETVGKGLDLLARLEAAGVDPEAVDVETLASPEGSA